jgi:hypothetical protein
VHRVFDGRGDLQWFFAKRSILRMPCCAVTFARRDSVTRNGDMRVGLFIVCVSKLFLA